MHVSKAQKIISLVLLLYFAAFIIPPVSSFSSSKKYKVSLLDQVSMEQDHRQTRLYLVDILLWFQLKQSRHSDSYLIALSENRHDSGPSLSAHAGALNAAPAMDSRSRAYKAVSLTAGCAFSRSSTIRFERSGISPPSLS